MKASFKTPPVEHHQGLLFPSNIYDRLPEHNQCRLYHDLFQQLDTTAVEKSYST